MKKPMFYLAAILAITAIAAGQQKAPAVADVAATLKALEEKWSAAQVKGDFAAMESILADAFVFTDVEGNVKTKADMLRDARSGDLKILSAKVDDMRVMVYGDAAVVIGRWKGKGTERGKPFEDVERWTDTWVRRKGQWRCVASQSTLVKE